MTPDDHDIVLQAVGLYRSFGSKQVLHDVNLRIIRGEIVSLVGPSGCGKSTLLNMIVGMLRPTAGALTIQRDGVMAPIVRPGRDRGIVYQAYALYPFLTAQQNVALGPKLAETSYTGRVLGTLTGRWSQLRRRHMDEAAELLGKVGLGDAIGRYPHELSGGMRQRVAIAQALIMRPQVLLLDEPFGALDEATREELQKMLLELYQENLAAREVGEPPPNTIIIVTHELNEAILVGDRLVGLSQHWDYRAAGFDTHPGATVVFDKVMPVYEPGEARQYAKFHEIREQIRAVVFEPRTPPALCAHAVFWDQVAAGLGQGGLAPRSDQR
jgi:NitT/TauT family transport system ATP-binding protein